MSEEQTHKTSEVKGTIIYMSPEMFMNDDVSPALDIYSLGIIMHILWSGADPYSGQAPAVTILSKVRGVHHPDEARLPALQGCSEGYQQLVWDCTLPDRRQRPVASEVVARLEALVQATPKTE